MPAVALTINAEVGQQLTLVQSMQPPLDVQTAELPTDIPVFTNLSMVQYVDRDTTALVQDGNIEQANNAPIFADVPDYGAVLATNLDYSLQADIAVAAGAIAQYAAIAPTRPVFGLDQIPFNQPTWLAASIGAGGLLYLNGITLSGNDGISASGDTGSKLYAEKSVFLAAINVGAVGAADSVFGDAIVSETTVNLDGCVLASSVTAINIGSSGGSRFTDTQFLGATVITFTGAIGVVEVDSVTDSYMTAAGVTVVNGTVQVL